MLVTITAKLGTNAIAFSQMSAQAAVNKALELASEGYTDIMIGNPATGAQINAQQFMRDQNAQGS